ncbi:MAG TPA: HlyD family efflux transporter periplasmic adaptor subunit [Candidatus Solibacter sp.]|nr:HlyD family efflux transporter periplasmic adaptor subunit [Candidatus Solibacter sp.]
MNLTRVLNVALPEIPARTLSQRPPSIPPGIVFQEHDEEGRQIVRVLVASQEAMYKFPRANWTLIQLFDGYRTFEQIAQLYSKEMGCEYSAEEIRDFSDSIEKLGFWYRTPQERNIQLMQMTSEQRRKLAKSRKSRFGDLSEITFPAFNPDKFVTWLYLHTSWVYTWWFTLITIAAFSIAAGISIAHWDQVGRDTLQFYNFTDKSWWDFLVFYLLAVIILGWHELGHAHTCKHFGGRVPAMGFLLIYLTPAFYTDTSEGFVKGSRYQRFLIAMAGVWAELWVYALVTPIWWGTPPGTEIHNAAYLMMLMSGIAGLLLNWNPLMKLDGYHMLCEIIQISELKEDSTAYLSAWVRRHIWRLPVEVPYVPKRRRLGFAVYALLSGIYSYTVLYVLAHFAGNIFRNFNPEWSFLPELGVAGLIFRSRIRKLVDFMKFIYLDKKDRIRAWLGTRPVLGAVGLVAVFFALPVWHETAVGRFTLEPADRAIVRNRVAGLVTDVDVREGQVVSPGTPLLQLRNIPLESIAAQTDAEYLVTSELVNNASLHYHSGFGPDLQERKRLDVQSGELKSQTRELELTSPIAGVVLTPRVDDRLGTFLPEGTALLEVADLSHIRVRIFISEYDIHDVAAGARARLEVEGIAKKLDAQVAAISPISSEAGTGLVEKTRYEGLNAPKFYIADVLISNPGGALKPGMVGAARIYGRRRSLLGLASLGVARFFGRKVW